MIVNNTMDAQAIGYKIKNENRNNKIALSDIIGNWYAADSSGHKISFVNINNYFVTIEGIKDGVGNYHFMIDGDSVSVNGTAPNWPPYDCTLHLTKNNTLRIEFYQYYFTASTTINYRRWKN